MITIQSSPINMAIKGKHLLFTIPQDGMCSFIHCFVNSNFANQPQSVSYSIGISQKADDWDDGCLIQIPPVGLSYATCGNQYRPVFAGGDEVYVNVEDACLQQCEVTFFAQIIPV